MIPGTVEKNLYMDIGTRSNFKKQFKNNTDKVLTSTSKRVILSIVNKLLDIERRDLYEVESRNECYCKLQRVI